MAGGSNLFKMLKYGTAGYYIAGNAKIRYG